MLPGEPFRSQALSSSPLRESLAAVLRRCQPSQPGAQSHVQHSLFTPGRLSPVSASSLRAPVSFPLVCSHCSPRPCSPMLCPGPAHVSPCPSVFSTVLSPPPGERSAPDRPEGLLSFQRPSLSALQGALGRPSGRQEHSVSPLELSWRCSACQRLSGYVVCPSPPVPPFERQGPGAKLALGPAGCALIPSLTAHCSPTSRSRQG